MSPQLERGLLLFMQSRYELAEAELRQALANEPREAYGHAMLGLCLAKREQFKEATEEAEQAVHLAPDFAFAHYALADILHDRNHHAEAKRQPCPREKRFNPERRADENNEHSAQPTHSRRPPRQPGDRQRPSVWPGRNQRPAGPMDEAHARPGRFRRRR